MKINSIQITIRPFYYGTTKELLVEVVADGKAYCARTAFEDDHFESLFDHLMDHSKLEIRRIVKAGQLTQPS